MLKENIILKILLENGITQFGFTDFKQILNRLIPCSKLKNIPQNAKTIFSFLFAFYAGEFKSSNISKYAIAPDYHTIILNKLKKVSQLLKERFIGFEFVPFCDNSPIPEVYTAALAGLGCIGKNGLLIHPKYGSFVFIGEIITDMKIETTAASIKPCEDCGICIKNCPAGALNQNKFERSKCLSFITQKKDELTNDEEALIKKTGCIWGCDICQNLCPMNREIAKTEISEFRNNLKPLITQDELDDVEFETKNSERAYLWKGKAVLKRNLCIINDTKDDNKVNSKKFEKE
jgi:epoxyqueuosine reductase